MLIRVWKIIEIRFTRNVPFFEARSVRLEFFFPPNQIGYVLDLSVLCTWSTVQLWCCVNFFSSGGKQFLVLRTYLVYNTVVRLCHFCCCGGKVNFVRIPYCHDRFSKNIKNFLCKKIDLIKNLRTRRPNLSCFVWIYNRTVTIVSQKISRTLFNFLNNTYWFSLFQRNSSLIFRTGVSCFSVALFYSILFCCGEKANLVRFTLFYSTLLALTHRQMDGQTDGETN